MRLSDDLLKAIGHKDDIRPHMSDAEIITTAFVAAIFFFYEESQISLKVMRTHVFQAQG